MRVAVLSDMNGNLRALEAVTDDLRRQAPDLVVHAGDLALNGPRPAEVVPLAEPPDREDATAASTGRSGVLPREIVGR